MSITIGVCVNDRDVLHRNLLDSPELALPHPYQLITVEGATSAADGLQTIRAAARHEVVLLAHQDVWFPNGSINALVDQWSHHQEALGGKLGALGVAGVDTDRLLRMDVMETRGHFRYGIGPAVAHTLDEIVLMTGRLSPRLDERLGWHLYGTDLCLRVRAEGQVAMISPVLVHHNTAFTHLDQNYWDAAHIVEQTWPDQLPVRSTCSMIGAAE